MGVGDVSPLEDNSLTSEGSDNFRFADDPPRTRKLSSISLVNECVGMKSPFENPHSASSVDNR